MIKNAHFVNFKSLGDVKITDLGQIAVFVGPNASGKTSILEGLEIMSRLGTKRADEVLQGRLAPEELMRRGAEPAAMKIVVSGEWDGESDSFQLRGRWKKNGTMEIELDSQSAKEERQRKQTPSFVTELLSGTFGAAVDSATFLRLNPEELVSPSFSSEQYPRVAFDGSGLATVLREMQASRPETFAEVVRLLKEIVPAVEGVRTRRAPVRVNRQKEISVDGKAFTREDVEEIMGEEVIFDMVGAENIAAHAVSEGTILTLGLLTVLMNDKGPRLLLLDDIGQALHPKALGSLIEVLRKLLALDEGLQIVATSHSPYLLDHLEAHEIWLTKLDESGQTLAQRLDAHREFDAWKDEMSPGEFWSYVGEDWLEDQDDE